MVPTMQDVTNIARSARRAQPRIGTSATETKNAVLRRVAATLRDRQNEILEANSRDVEAGNNAGLSKALIDRLRLTPERIEAIAQGVLDIVELADPVGRMDNVAEQANGLRIGRMQIPLGVIAIIFESRPNVVIDAGALCLKSGNAVILKGGKEAHHSNVILANILCEALVAEDLPEAVIQLLTERSQVTDLLQLDEYVDLVIPRGGEGLIRSVCENSRIPVVRHYKGVCHVYVDESADVDMATDIVVNAKTQRPGVCNAMETLLVHQDMVESALPQIVSALQERGVVLRGCAKTRAALPTLEEATEEDWHAEYLDLILAVRVVDDMNAAIEHIDEYGSNHTESIVTNNEQRAQSFVQRVCSSAVMVNASTRFNDGGQLGLGAEIGISTSKVHAFGPMGINELTIRKFVVFGQGHTRQ
jgi:glutamate-5-semialdehyde dehydrogenase